MRNKLAITNVICSPHSYSIGTKLEVRHLYFCPTVAVYDLSTGVDLNYRLVTSSYSRKGVDGFLHIICRRFHVMTFVNKLTNVALHGGNVTMANVLTIVGLAKVITLYRYSRSLADIVQAQHQECTVITTSVV